MEPADDPKLRELLREWKVEEAPQRLRARIPALRQPWWREVFTGSVRVPGPVALLAAAAIVLMAVALLRAPSAKPPATRPSPGGLAGFQPVQVARVRIMESGQ
jgi:hypothetical protein